jgi:hypothetical protein
MRKDAHNGEKCKKDYHRACKANPGFCGENGLKTLVVVAFVVAVTRQTT